MKSESTSVDILKLGRWDERAQHERTASRPWRLASASGGFAGCAALMIGILVCATPALAGTVTQSVSAFRVGTSGDSQTDITVSSLLPSILQTGNKDEAFASGVLNGPAGTATINVHGCSGPPFPGSGGTADGGVNLDFNDTYRITSDTLPIGTPVFISLVANAARRETATLNVDAGFENTFNGVQVSGDARIVFSLPSAGYAFPGSFRHTNSLVDGEFMSHDGLFGGQDSQQLKTVVGGKLQAGVVPALVGDYVSVGVVAGVHAGSEAAFRALADGDSQMVLNWGIHPFDSAIRIVNVTYPGEPVPDNSNLTLDPLLLLLPPRPPTVDIPEPGTFILLGQALAASLGVAWWRRRRSRSSQ